MKGSESSVILNDTFDETIQRLHSSNQELIIVYLPNRIFVDNVFSKTFSTASELRPNEMTR